MPKAAAIEHANEVECQSCFNVARSEHHLLARLKTVPADGRPIEGLEPLVSEPVVYRRGVSAFSSSAFRSLVAGFGCELVIIGYSMSSSCLATAMVAYDNGLAVTLVEDAVSASPVDSS